jgi:molybdopterin converting factor subunit 1
MSLIAMLVNLKFFASCREIVGVNGIQIELVEGTNTALLLDVVVKQFPQLSSQLQDISLAVNKSYIESDTVLNDGDEVAFLPPISGG